MSAPVYHFVESGGPIPAAHTGVLRDHFQRAGLAVAAHGDGWSAAEAVPGDAYVTCDMVLDEQLDPVRDRVFEVQLAHNLTGLKGSPFGASRAQLNLLPGRQVLEHHGLDAGDPRFVIGGYPKWDRIFAERRHQVERRRAEASARQLDPASPWVVFYPTGPNAAFTSNAGRAVEIYLRLRRDLGRCVFLFCNHAHNDTDSETRRVVHEVRALGRRDPNARVIEGGDTLPLLAACDLFVTDVASSLLTAVSMDKPVLLVPITAVPVCQAATRAFQCAAFFDEVADLRAFVAGYRTPAPLRALFERCVAFDDEENCARITRIILERFAAWRERRR